MDAHLYLTFIYYIVTNVRVMGYWQNKVVLVTGGSVGLGRSIARAFAQRGADVIVAARNKSRLQAACQWMTQQGLNVSMMAFDVTDDQQVNDAIEAIIQQHGRLDVLINNVGRSTRIEWSKATPEEYQELMDLNFLSVVRCTQAAMPYLVQSKGHVVNIGSLSSKTAWPYLAPYTTSKFAVAGYTHQLRLEGPPQVHVMLVCPGPILREDAGSRYNQEAEGLPSEAQMPGAGARIKGINPDRLAERIVWGCQQRKAEIIVPFRARILFVLAELWPRVGDWILAKMVR